MVTFDFGKSLCANVTWLSFRKITLVSCDCDSFNINNLVTSNIISYTVYFINPNDFMCKFAMIKTQLLMLCEREALEDAFTSILYDSLAVPNIHSTTLTLSGGMV